MGCERPYLHSGRREKWSCGNSAFLLAACAEHKYASYQSWSSLMFHFFFSSTILTLLIPILISNPALIPSEYVDSNKACRHWVLLSIAFYWLFFCKIHILLYPAETILKKNLQHQYQFIKPVRHMTCFCQPKIGSRTDLGPSFALLLLLMMIIINHLSCDICSILAASQLKNTEKNLCLSGRRFLLRFY